MEFLQNFDKKRTVKIVIIVLLIFILDQFTKWLAYHYLQAKFSIPVLGDFFRLTYVENPGMAFGIRIYNKYLFNGLSVIAALILVFYLTHLYPGKANFSYAIASILGGAAGNLYDRLTTGKVIDFFDFEFFDVNIPRFKILFIKFPGYSMTRWPVFNIADIAVFVGMVFVFLLVFFEYERGEHENGKPESGEHLDDNSSMMAENE